jgi:predicted nucleic acid-binding protein
LADTRRNKAHLGIDSNVLVAYLVPDHPDHELTKYLVGKRHAVNPTVLHETYHTCVFKLKRKAEKTITTLLDYMDYSLCLPMDSATVQLGLKLALEHSLGGRDALILASYGLSKQVKEFVTLDGSLLSVQRIRIGRKKLNIVRPASDNVSEPSSPDGPS